MLMRIVPLCLFSTIVVFSNPIWAAPDIDRFDQIKKVEFTHLASLPAWLVRLNFLPELLSKDLVSLGESGELYFKVTTTNSIVTQLGFPDLLKMRNKILEKNKETDMAYFGDLLAGRIKNQRVPFSKTTDVLFDVKNIPAGVSYRIIVGGADWCPWCRPAVAKLHKILTRYPVKYAVEIVYVDVTTANKNSPLVLRALQSKSLGPEEEEFLPMFLVQKGTDLVDYNTRNNFLNSIISAQR